MVSFPADTLLSSSHPSRSGPWLPALRPALSRAAPSCAWHLSNDAFDPLFIAQCTDTDYPHVSFPTTHALQHAPTSFNLLYPDALNVCPSPPSSSSASKPLPEDAHLFASLYSTHLAGVLDSPPVLRREVLASQKPLTPPPTMPQTICSLPDDLSDVNVDVDVDVDAPFYDSEESDMDDSSSSSSTPSSPQPVQSVLPLSPLSPPSWDPGEALSIGPSQDFREPEPLHALFSPCDSSAPPALDFRHPSPLSPHQPSSLLEVDADVDIDLPHPLLAPIDIPWAPSKPSKSDPEPPSFTSSSSLTSLTDYDELPPPSSPLISRLDLPDLEDDPLPEIVPSSPSRRSYSCLPDSDIEMTGLTSDSAQALTGQHLLSLPGADTDEDLIRTIPSPSRSFPLAPSQPLLFIDDPRDVPLPRSPSPEDFDLCLSPDNITDPDLAKLFDLRKRSIAAERNARRLEALTDNVDLFKRAEARKTRKRERERCKEVGALLRLKLGDGVWTSPQEQPSPEFDPHQARRRGVTIGNMSQLVAQMVFRRNETPRPLAKRKSGSSTREYVSSALSRPVPAELDTCEVDL